MKVSKIDRKLVVCECSFAGHQLIFSRFEDDSDVYIDFHLLQPKFWDRLKSTFNYLLGNPAPYSHFDEVILGEETVKELVEWLQNGKDERVA